MKLKFSDVDSLKVVMDINNSTDTSLTRGFTAYHIDYNFFTNDNTEMKINQIYPIWGMT